MQAWDKCFKIQHAQSEDTYELLRKLLEDSQIINEELAEYINSLSWNRPAFYDDDDEYSIQYKEYLEDFSNAIALVLPTENLDNSLSMGDEHLDTIPKTKSDKVIKSSVEDLVPIPSESEDILDNMCDVPFSDKNHFDFTGELVHIDPIPLGIDETDSDPKDEIRFIEQLLYDDTSSEDDSFKDIIYVEASPPDSELVSLKEDSDFSSSDDSLRSGLEVSFPSRTKIFDPGIFFEVQSERFLSQDTFSLTYVSLPFEEHHYLSVTYVIQTFLPYFTYLVESPFLISSESEDTIFDPGISAFYFSHQNGTFIASMFIPTY
uniref:Uncharacterized protein n=1 Tax=Tanacetum cinerariifolium TaxID=118510 RepID=A0A699KK64_TANCI|nr:hypothetical protein [Tanacetum cinerariifolium]